MRPGRATDDFITNSTRQITGSFQLITEAVPAARFFPPPRRGRAVTAVTTVCLHPYTLSLREKREPIKPLRTADVFPRTVVKAWIIRWIFEIELPYYIKQVRRTYLFLLLRNYCVGPRNLVQMTRFTASDDAVTCKHVMLIGFIFSSRRRCGHAIKILFTHLLQCWDVAGNYSCILVFNCC